MNVLQLIGAMPKLRLDSIVEDQDSVYFIESAGLVKVGYSGTPRKRLQGLINSTGAPVHILAVAPGSWFRERHLHSLLSESRHHSEWFGPTMELIAWVRAAQKAGPEWHSLPDGVERRRTPVLWVRDLTAKERKKSEKTQADTRALLQLLAEAERAGEIAAEKTRDEFLRTRDPELAARQRLERAFVWESLGMTSEAA